MIGIRRVILLVLLAGTWAACDTQEQQDEFAQEASRPPQDFTRTDDGGDELDVDEDDWRIAPVYAGKISIPRPAYPNPADAGEFVTVEVSVTSFGLVSAPLRIETIRDDRLFRLDQIDEAADPGLYIFNFSAASLGGQGLHRVYIFDGVGEIVSYGDIMVE